MNRIKLIRAASLLAALSTAAALALKGDYMNASGVVFASLSSTGLLTPAGVSKSKE